MNLVLANHINYKLLLRNNGYSLDKNGALGILMSTNIKLFIRAAKLCKQEIEIL